MVAACGVEPHDTAGLVDHLHLAIIPVVLGRGERLFTDGLTDGYTCTRMVASDAATHMILTRS